MLEEIEEDFEDEVYDQTEFEAPAQAETEA